MEIDTSAPNQKSKDHLFNHGASWLRVAALLGGLAVVTGAFAAHGLGERLETIYEGETRQVVGGTEIPAAQKYLQDFKTAAEYQMYHALALLALGLAFPRLSTGPAKVAGHCFLWGTILFSGSLYVLVLTGITKLGAITPVGGLLLIVGWVALAWSARTRDGERSVE